MVVVLRVPSETLRGGKAIEQLNNMSTRISKKSASVGCNECCIFS